MGKQSDGESNQLVRCKGAKVKYICGYCGRVGYHVSVWCSKHQRWECSVWRIKEERKPLKIMRIICFIKTLYRTLSSSWFWDGVEITGHSFVKQDDGSLICEVCGQKR